MAAYQTNISTNTGNAMGDNYGQINFNAPLNRESQLRKIIDLILSKEPVEADTSVLTKYDTEDYTISDKIDYNCLNDEWVEILYDFTAFETTIDDALQNNTTGISQKGKFLFQLRFYYRKAKKELNIPNNQSEISSKSTEILEKVRQYHLDFLKEKDESKEHYDEYTISLLVAFGFVECKILEKPMAGNVSNDSSK